MTILFDLYLLAHNAFKNINWKPKVCLLKTGWPQSSDKQCKQVTKDYGTKLITVRLHFITKRVHCETFTGESNWTKLLR